MHLLLLVVVLRVLLHLRLRVVIINVPEQTLLLRTTITTIIQQIHNLQHHTQTLLQI